MLIKVSILIESIFDFFFIDSDTLPIEDCESS